MATGLLILWLCLYLAAMVHKSHGRASFSRRLGRYLAEEQCRVLRCSL